MKEYPQWSYPNKYFQDSQVQIRWMPDDHLAELFLDTSTGELDVQSLDEMLE